MRIVPAVVAFALVVPFTAVAQEVPRITPAPTAHPQLRPQDTQLPSPEVLKQSVHQVTRRLSRQTLINGLLKSQKGRALLQRAADDSGMAPGQLAVRSLNGTQVITPDDVSRDAVSGFTPPPRDPVNYDDLDWEQGVRITLRGEPEFEEGGVEYQVGALVTNGAYFWRLWTVSDAFEQNAVQMMHQALPPHRTEPQDWLTIEVEAELPEGYGEYIVTVHLDPGGWVATWPEDDFSEYFYLRRWVAMVGTDIYEEMGVHDIAPLGDAGNLMESSGFVFGFSGHVEKDFSQGSYDHPPLRERNFHFIMRYKQQAWGTRFGGVTITRL